MSAPAITIEPATGHFLARAIPDLAAQVAHDLNNHLATMLGKSELALMLDDPGRYRPTIGEILDAGQPARLLVADLQRVLSWSRAAAEPVPLCEVLAIVVRLASRRAERIGIQICCRPGPEPTLCDDPALLTLLARGVVCAALEQNVEDERTWILTSRTNATGVTIVLEAPGLQWSDSARAQAGASDALGAVLESPLGCVASGVQEMGGRLVLETNGASLTL